MTKAEARAYELAVQAANDWRAGLVHFFAFDSALKAYGDVRAVEAEIKLLKDHGCIVEDSERGACRAVIGQLCWFCAALADAEQRERELP